MIKILELFAGSKSVGKVADGLFFESYSSDIEQFGGVDYVTDILDFDVTKIPFKPDVIWASPPCTAFSVAAIGKNWTKVGNDYIPKNPRAELGLKLVQKTLEIIEHFNPTYFFIENPRGMLRKMPIMAHLKRQGVTYCQYGDTRMKPTDIWTNSDKWIPRPCVPTDLHVTYLHQEAQELALKDLLMRMKEARFQRISVLRY